MFFSSPVIYTRFSVICFAVLNFHQENEPPCSVLFSLLNSPIRHLQFLIAGDRLVVGFECGQVSVFQVTCCRARLADLLWLIVDWQYNLNKFQILTFFYVPFQVTVLDTNTLSVLFHANCVATTSSPLISLAAKPFSDSPFLISSPKDSKFKSSGNGIILLLTKDAQILLIDGTTGSMISSQLKHPDESAAISIHIFGKYFQRKE